MTATTASGARTATTSCFGEDGNDDQFGELGDDTMWGGAGEDAMVGDRGGVQTRYVEANGSDAGDPLVLTHNSLGPPGINLGGPNSGPQDAVLRPFIAHPLDRRTSLSHDRDGSVLTQGGHVAGGNDRMRGGPGHDSMHGADGNDLMNGDSGGDYAYGDDGADVMWGGRGRPEVLTPDIPSRNDMGVDGQWIDVIFGGFGVERDRGRRRHHRLPAENRASTRRCGSRWWRATPTRRRRTPGSRGASTTTAPTGSTAAGTVTCSRATSPPTARTAATSCSTGTAPTTSTPHCNAAYGGWNDVRKPDPNNILGLERLAYVTGATADFTGRPVLADVQTTGTSAFREVAIVYTQGPEEQLRQGLLQPRRATSSPSSARRTEPGRQHRSLEPEVGGRRPPSRRAKGRLGPSRPEIEGRVAAAWSFGRLRLSRAPYPLWPPSGYG